MSTPIFRAPTQGGCHTIPFLRLSASYNQPQNRLDNATIKAKIAKLLRLQQSSNANEAANAAAFVEKLCVEHGINPDDVGQGYSLADEAERRDLLCMGQKVNYAKASLLSAIAEYYNGKACLTYAKDGSGQKVVSVVASQGSFIQIELYFDYLYETGCRLADEAKSDRDYTSRLFKQGFLKGFAQEICVRLREMKKAQERDLSLEGTAKHGHALVRINNALALYNREFPRAKEGYLCLCVPSLQRSFT